MIPRSGNYLVDQKDDEKEKDLFHCPQCECEVEESEFNHKRGICYSCWWHLT